VRRDADPYWANHHLMHPLEKHAASQALPIDKRAHRTAKIIQPHVLRIIHDRAVPSTHSRIT
jgi:hypothetical protein